MVCHRYSTIGMPVMAGLSQTGMAPKYYLLLRDETHSDWFSYFVALKLLHHSLLLHSICLNQLTHLECTKKEGKGKERISPRLISKTSRPWFRAVLCQIGGSQPILTGNGPFTEWPWNQLQHNHDSCAVARQGFFHLLGGCSLEDFVIHPETLLATSSCFEKGKKKTGFVTKQERLFFTAIWGL